MKSDISKRLDRLDALANIEAPVETEHYRTNLAILLAAARPDQYEVAHRLAGFLSVAHADDMGLL